MAQLARLESGAAVAAQPAHAAGVHVQASRDASGFENLAYYTIIGTQDTDYTIYLIGPDRALATRTILSIPGAARDSPDYFTYMFQVCLVHLVAGIKKRHVKKNRQALGRQKLRKRDKLLAAGLETAEGAAVVHVHIGNYICTMAEARELWRRHPRLMGAAQARAGGHRSQPVEYTCCSSVPL